MKITKMLPQIVIFPAFNVILFVASASIPSQCEIPTSLKVHFESLPRADMGNNFFLPVEFLRAEKILTPLSDGNQTSPESNDSSGNIRESSTSPWYLKTTYNSTLYFPTHTEAVCPCNNCQDSNHNHHCAKIFSKITVLKRTRECVGELCVYKPIVIDVATACVCARKVRFTNKGNEKL
ncbi:uncharacterized protein LOC115223181 [Octopus sinensis]|uniref:Uncharacterized protein LOC115222992 n=1 Tax=Octopus sinensis TaxID=2607531 RepID=A0A6P7THQ7_9MOLL|nr:uncharacterized protein LOC115222992 [Octopus sinensis]XP_029649528.1 uncharacterized protein LOC115223181 [Octopus sinensis]